MYISHTLVQAGVWDFYRNKIHLKWMLISLK